MHAVHTLTAQQRKVFELARTTLTNKEIGARLNISERTVKFHLVGVYQKMGVSKRMDIVSKFGKDGEIGPSMAYYCPYFTPMWRWRIYHWFRRLRNAPLHPNWTC